MRYYIADETQPLGFLEVTETEYVALFGDETIRPYVSKVYSGEISIFDVPIHLQASVQAVVNNRISRWGIYEETNIQIEKEVINDGT